MVRMATSMDLTSKGRILFGEAHLGDASPDEARRRRDVEDALRRQLQGEPNTFVTAIDAIRRVSRWRVRAEVVAPRVPTPAEIDGVERAAARTLGEPVELTVRARTEVVVTRAVYHAVGQLPARGQDAP